MPIIESVDAAGLMKKFEVLVVASSGAAAAIPGIAVAKQFEFPSGTNALFSFALVTFTSATVLTAYSVRRLFENWLPGRVLTFSGLGMLVVLLLFLLHIWLTAQVQVRFTFGAQKVEQTAFFPLNALLSREWQDSVKTYKSKRLMLNKYGPEKAADATTETNFALTIGVLITSYTALVGALAIVFSAVGFYALGETPGPDGHVVTKSNVQRIEQGAAGGLPSTPIAPVPPAQPGGATPQQPTQVSPATPARG